MKRRSEEGDQPIPAKLPAADATSSRGRKILGSLDRFAPETLVVDSHLTRRANQTAHDRTVAHIILAVFFVSLISAMGQGFKYYQMAPTGELKDIVLSLYACALVFACLALTSFKYLHRSTSTLSNSYAGFSLLLTIGLHTLTGFNMQSPIIPLYFFIPTWAFLTSSSHSGVWWSIIVASVLVVSTVIEPLPLSFPNIIPADSMASVQLINALSAIVLIAICLYTQQGSFLTLTGQLNEDRQLYAHKAQHDPLTGLANREQFDVNLQQALDNVTLNRQYAALIYIDLNDFKEVNDTHGHQVGDGVLKIIAQRIDQVVRDGDTTARLGGDEFGIVLPQLRDRKIVTRIVRKLEVALAEPMQIDDISLAISGSVGMAIAPENGREPASLTRHADRNMYEAKTAQARLKLVSVS